MVFGWPNYRGAQWAILVYFFASESMGGPYSGEPPFQQAIDIPSGGSYSGSFTWTMPSGEPNGVEISAAVDESITGSLSGDISNSLARLPPTTLL